MSERRPFKEIKLQWLQLLSRDHDLGDCAKSVALYIVTTHMNGHTEKAWPSFQTIADAMGKSVKTIQRAVRELETGGWFEVRRGNGVGHNTEYRPSTNSILRAGDLREKTAKIVPLRPLQDGQRCPERQSNVSHEGGHRCPPNPERELINKPNAHARARHVPTIPKIFLAGERKRQIEEWQAWLIRHDLPPLEQLSIAETRNGKLGFVLPSYWAPSDQSTTSTDVMAFLKRRTQRITQQACLHAITR